MRGTNGWRVVEDIVDDVKVVNLIPEGSDPERESKARKAVVEAQVRAILFLASENGALGILDGEEDLIRRMSGA